MFDHGAGGCLWAGDDAARAVLGDGPVDAAVTGPQGRVIRPAALRLSPVAQGLRDGLLALHLTRLNPVYPPDPALWSQARCDRFNAGVAVFLARLRQDLVGRWQIIHDQPPLAEDPALAAWLDAHPGHAVLT